jgi:glutamine amidotransferase
MKISSTHIHIPNYGCGNLGSIVRMIERAGGTVEVINEPEKLAHSKKIILAGVGSFDYGMKNLEEGQWINPLNEAVFQRRIPILGICLGMQMMCKRSEEGQRNGLDWVDADVVRFQFSSDSPLKIPHMGWNTVSVAKPNPLISKSDEKSRFYFVHSYYAVCNKSDEVLATVRHGFEFCAAFQNMNIFGVQFHPEKSHRFGMNLIKKFVEL